MVQRVLFRMSPQSFSDYSHRGGHSSASRSAEHVGHVETFVFGLFLLHLSLRSLLHLGGGRCGSSRRAGGGHLGETSRNELVEVLALGALKQLINARVVGGGSGSGEDFLHIGGRGVLVASEDEKSVSSNVFHI